MDEIIALLCPDAIPTEEGYLWARFQVNRIEGCRNVYYCANQEIAAEILVNQIKPGIQPMQGYFTIFPYSDTVEIGATRTELATSFAVVHYGCFQNYKSESIARTNTTKLLELYRESQNRYITSIRINNTTFSKWSDDNSPLEQYIATVTVNAVTPYALANDCRK